MARSPNYPAVSLPEAVELVDKLYRAERRSPVDIERAALALGYNSLSGPPRSKISALRKYGLLEDTGNGLRVSERAMTIMNPLSEEEKVQALRDAALEPALFRELASYEGASDANLTARLIRMGFTEAGAKLAVASYRETISLVEPEARGYDGPHVEAPSPASTHGQAHMSVTPASIAPLGVTLKGGVRIEVRFPQGEMTPEVIETLRSFFNWSESVRPDPVEQDEQRPSPAPELPSSALVPLPEQSPGDVQD